MFQRAIGAALLALALAGCATGNGRVVDTAEFPAVRKSYDITFGWKSTPAGTGVRVDGYARNNRLPRVEDLELNLSLRDGSGREKARQTFYFIPLRLEDGDLAPFTITLPVRPEPGDRFRFLYRYRETDDDSGGSWMDSFEVPAATE